MQSQDKTKAQLISEITQLRQRVAALEAAESLRGQAEAARRETEDKYQAILDHIEDGYYEVDLAGNLTFCNQALSAIKGYAQEELLGVNYRQYASAETAKQLFQAFNQVYRTGEPATDLEYEIIRRDGTRRFVATT